MQPSERANNWNILNLAGEYLKSQAGFTTLDYVEESLEHQMHHFTDLGMYVEDGCPLPYDQQVRLLLAVMLKYGYRGRFYKDVALKILRATWASLFMQSPFGDFPSGHRSSHHLWNEAQAVALYELFATEYALSQQPQEAAVFKRAAHLSFEVIRRWIRSDGSGYIVKNKAPS